MTDRDKLISRLENWKFTEALSYARDLPDDLRQLVVRLADLWGDSGWGAGGALPEILAYTVAKLISDIKLHGVRLPR